MEAGATDGDIDVVGIGGCVGVGVSAIVVGSGVAT